LSVVESVISGEACSSVMDNVLATLNAATVQLRAQNLSGRKSKVSGKKSNVKTFK
jgi:hypothetical protein